LIDLMKLRTIKNILCERMGIMGSTFNIPVFNTQSEDEF
jgi:hypothetical protein